MGCTDWFIIAFVGFCAITIIIGIIALFMDGVKKEQNNVIEILLFFAFALCIFLIIGIFLFKGGK